jgi:hypothetical protein
MLSTNRSPTVKNGCQNGIHSCQRPPIQYELAKDILIYNIVTRFYIIWTITWSLAIIMGDSEINDNKKTHQTQAISMAMGMRRCNAGRIAQ